MKRENNRLYVIFGGGIGKFGANFTIFSYNQKNILIDAGIGFPNQNTPGISKTLPNIELLHSFPLSAIIITHAHEDHVGALPYLYEMIEDKTPIFASPFSIALIKHKLKDYGIKNEKFEFRSIEDNILFQHFDFEINSFFMPHSIPQSFSIGLTIKDLNMKIFFSGDFKTKGAEKRFNSKDLEKFSGVDYLFCDSTGSLIDGYSEDENIIINNLSTTIKEWKGRVFITTFASHIQRISGLYQIAKKTGRSFGILGFSIRAQLRAAYESGEIDFPLHSIKNPSGKDQKSLWIIAGCQAEDNSSFFKLSNKETRRFHLDEHDLLIYSGSMIPGNEESIYNVLNEFAESGVNLLGLGNSYLHASGHGRKKDISQLLKWLKPKRVLPVHGDAVHFHAFRNILEDENFDAKLYIPEVNTLYDLNSEMNKIQSIESEFFMVENDDIHKDYALCKRRKELGKEGICNIVVDAKTYDLKSLNYIGSISSSFLDKHYDLLYSQVNDILKNNINSDSKQKEKKIKEKIFKLNQSVIKKSPFINLIMI
ncbi:MAG: ribonuclease J [Spirochaetia bacterium]|nr:ribonuclease J [Spirochaetia bacterium]